jgi:1-acyl-sn-glycerol-3-phosphate acyltransferase
MVRFFYIYTKKELVYILKFFIRLALSIFCTEVHIKNKHLLDTKGALLIIANHPNSFLDAIIIGAYYNRPVYFLARGDVFKKKHHRFLLNALNMIPVYRLREGKEFLHLNDYAFQKSIELISKGAAVLVFIEGTCINNHSLQPFKKGTTRILAGLHEKNIFPAIHIVGISYNHFYGIGKKINIILSNFIYHKKIEQAVDRVRFNQQVFSQLEQNIIIEKKSTFIKRTIWYYLHKPYYSFIKNWTYKKTKGTVFFDSVLFSLLLFTYPLFLGLIFILLYQLTIPLPIIFGILLVIPFLSKNSLS